MEVGPQQPKEREDAISALNKAIEVLNLAKGASTIAPAKAVFGSVNVFLSTIRVCLLLVLLSDCRLKCTQDTLINRADCVELGLACADVCTALSKELDGKKSSDLNNSAREVINQLTT